jgi:uncharacterized membrane protein YeaQ/YmgE (transglycosylase-associated protein family)
MSIVLFILFGLIIGLLARAIMPGRQSMSLIVTAIVGMVGSFVGGVIGNAIHGTPILRLQQSGFIGSLIGALVVLALVGWVGKRRRALQPSH